MNGKKVVELMKAGWKLYVSNPFGAWVSSPFDGRTSRVHLNAARALVEKKVVKKLRWIDAITAEYVLAEEL
jgi:hypothetical protein